MNSIAYGTNEELPILYYKHTIDRLEKKFTYIHDSIQTFSQQFNVMNDDISTLGGFRSGGGSGGGKKIGMAQIVAQVIDCPIILYTCMLIHILLLALYTIIRIYRYIGTESICSLYTSSSTYSRTPRRRRNTKNTILTTILPRIRIAKEGLKSRRQ